jgi:hypothetical protein
VHASLLDKGVGDIAAFYFVFDFIRRGPGMGHLDDCEASPIFQLRCRANVILGKVNSHRAIGIPMVKMAWRPIVGFARPFSYRYGMLKPDAV